MTKKIIDKNEHNGITWGSFEWDRVFRLSGIHDFPQKSGLTGLIQRRIKRGKELPARLSSKPRRHGNAEASAQILPHNVGVTLPALPGGLITRPTLVWDVIDHTPRNERVTLKLGSAFDVTLYGY